MVKPTADKKPRVYEVAKELGMSSEAVLQIVKRLGVEVKNHMSTLLPETVQRLQAEMAQEKTAVREEQARKHEQELQRAREERARAAQVAAQTAATAAATRPAPAPETESDAEPTEYKQWERRSRRDTAARPVLKGE